MTTLLQFEKNVDAEIQAYQDMEELYQIKQSVLVQGKCDALCEVDSKILDKIEQLKTLSTQRKQVSKFLGNEEMSMSEAINKAHSVNSGLAQRLTTQKAKLNALSGSLAVYERTNMDLIKHGLVLTNKTLNIIVNALAPQSNQYGSTGKNIERSNKMNLSTIVEEA